MKWRKKPVVIEAMQYDGTNSEAIEAWMAGHPGNFWAGMQGSIDDPRIAIRTMDGTMHARRTDMIIRGVKGEFYPCKIDIFRLTYEPDDTSPPEAES